MGEVRYRPGTLIAEGDLQGRAWLLEEQGSVRYVGFRFERPTSNAHAADARTRHEIQP